MGNSFLQNADKKEYQLKLKKINEKRTAFFKNIVKILEHNLAQYSFKQKITDRNGNNCLETSFDVPGEGFLSDVKAYVLDISNRQVVCANSKEDANTIIFSIIEEKTKHLTNPEKKSFTNFLEAHHSENSNGYTPKIVLTPIPAKEETATPVQEIVAPSELNLNLNSKPTTDMTVQQSEQAPQESTTLEELQVWMETFLSVRGFKQGSHYKNFEIDTENERVNLKATTPNIRQEMEAQLAKAKINFKRPAAENTKTLWFHIQKAESVGHIDTSPIVTNEKPSKSMDELRTDVVDAIKGEKFNTKDHYVSVVINDKRKHTIINCRTSQAAKKIHNFLKSNFDLLPLEEDSKSVKISGIKPEADSNELKTAQAKSKKLGRKPAVAPTEEEMTKLNTLREGVRTALKENNFSTTKDYMSIVINTVQKVIVIQCRSNEALERILSTLKKNNFDPDASTTKAIWVPMSTNKDTESKNDETLSETEVRKPIFPVPYQINDGIAVSKLSNEMKDLFDDYIKRGEEIVSLRQKLKEGEAKNFISDEKEMLQMAVQLFYFNTGLDNGGIELWLRVKMNDGTETNIPVTKQKFLEDFYSIFLAKQAK